MDPLTASPCLAFGASPGWGEMLLLFVVVLVLFGAKRLPEIARMIGKVISDLQRTSHDLRDQIMNYPEEPAAKAEPQPGSPPAEPAGGVVASEPASVEPAAEEAAYDEDASYEEDLIEGGEPDEAARDQPPAAPDGGPAGAAAEEEEPHDLAG
ncbi:MAG: twin-arginine translocase TatA/TatE family subunit [Kiritimatiellae bacterium]|nr:twin-arginine translocase TatA/TatE family subunit [Kiritimatiellia bacterium]